jgi:precorrin-3B synthase
VSTLPKARTRGDLCPGALRPWPAPDGALVRLRLPGGRLPSRSLAVLSEVATSHGDGDIHLTRRANLQLRALPAEGDRLTEAALEAIEGTGLLPSRSHELVRNFLVSPMTGLDGGRCDLRPVVADLDALVCDDPLLRELPGRFLFVLDDGRGDLVDRPADLGLVALDTSTAQLRVGSEGWGPVLPLDGAAPALVELARDFVRRRGDGPAAPWHVDELTEPLTDRWPRDERTGVSRPPLAYGRHGPVVHVPAPDGILSPALTADLVTRGPELVVTPWHGVLVDGRGTPR